MRTGRPPKPDGQKVTRHASTKPQVTLPARGRAGKAPAPVCDLSEPAAVLWAAMWKRPEATRWTLGDIPALTRLVWLEVNPTAWLDSRLLAEMRQLEDRFGMNPHARQAMGWSLEGDDAKPAAPTAPQATDRRAEAMRLIRGEAS